jgi:hypothetical protein
MLGVVEYFTVFLKKCILSYAILEICYLFFAAIPGPLVDSRRSYFSNLYVNFVSIGIGGAMDDELYYKYLSASVTNGKKKLITCGVHRPCLPFSFMPSARPPVTLKEPLVENLDPLV